MHLKSLILRGFKSFASTTTLSFEPGINCVVGPNGSGKSNVVDALAWVMGEQGAKNLRGGQMSDVIFAGTARRPALGRAEVSLTIDNTDGMLPIDYSEVTITRTLFRSGGSEYAINGTSCRLLDIQELLSDTGMGKEMHVIIGQGKLDQVLTASPEERRYFIEEAAGVLKHRRRKEKALRKLESMQGNLTRIEDLAGELRRQLGPLARQAATARRAQIIQREVFDARARLLADDLAQAQARLTAQSVDDHAFDQQREQIAQKIREIQAQVQKLEAELTGIDPKLTQLTQSWQRLTSLVEKYRGLIQLAQEREHSLRQNLHNISRSETPQTIRERAATAFSREEECTRAAQEAQAALDLAVLAREKAEAAERAIDSRLALLSRRLADRRESAARLGGKISTARSRIDLLSAESERVCAAKKAANQRVLSASAQIAQLERDIAVHAGGDESLSAAHEEISRELSEMQSVLERVRKSALEAATLQAEWRAKAQTLLLSLAPEDATAWLVRQDSRGVNGLVRDHLRICAGWEAAVEAALQGAAAGAVMDSVYAAIDALRGSRQAEVGHLELLIVPDGNASGAFDAVFDADAAGVSQGCSAGNTDLAESCIAKEDSGLRGEALADAALPVAEQDFGSSHFPVLHSAAANSANLAHNVSYCAVPGVAYDSAVKHAIAALEACDFAASEAILGVKAILSDSPANVIARKLLAGTVFAADLVIAGKLLQAGAPRVVTLAGDVLTPHHISGGEVQMGALLARQAMYEDALAQEKAAAERKSDADAAVADAEVKLAAMQEKFAAISTQLAARDSQLAAFSAQLGVLRQGLRSADEEVERNKNRHAKILEDLAIRQEELALLQSEYAQINCEPEENEEYLLQLQKERDVLHRQTVNARTEETQARLSLRTKEERLRAIAGKSEVLETQARALEARIVQEERQAARRLEAADQAAKIGVFAFSALTRAQELLAGIARQRQETEQERIAQDALLRSTRKNLAELQDQQRKLDDTAHRRELALTQLRANFQQLAAKAIDDLGLEADTLINDFGPHLMINIYDEASVAEYFSNTTGNIRGEDSAQKMRSIEMAFADSSVQEKQIRESSLKVLQQIPFVRSEQEQRLARGERDLARLGKINPLALEEHAALAERQHYLTEQLQDLRRSRADLLKIVRDIDRRVNEVMHSAFNDVAHEFELIFARLFPGGEGRLVLTDPDSPLTTGVEIEARPPGKRVKRLSLLSGGERSLTAIAFLVSIFKARPSPFYVMDEVEAALDDLNLSRLIEIFKELQVNSQLLVITHQKRTMEIADALYGVAMKEQGVTTVISQRLKELIK